MFRLFLLSLALSADAFAVSMCRARGRRSAFSMAITFGLFQAFMPVGGWMAGSALRSALSRFAPWAAFLILVIVGARMVWNSFRVRDGSPCSTGRGQVITLAFATSLDAFAAGVSLSLVGSGIWLPAAVIGMVTFLVCLLGAGIGVAAGTRLGGRMEMAAGLVMIALGIKALL